MFTLGADSRHAVAFGGNDTRGPIEVATALNAHGGPHGRQDFESETFVAQALRARDGSKGVDSDCTDTLVVAPATAATLTRGTDSAGKGGYAGRRQEDDFNVVAHTLRADGFDASEDGTGRGTPIVPVAIRTNQTGQNGSGMSEDVSFALGADEQPPAVAYDLRGREGGAQFEGPHETANIRASTGGSSRSYVSQRWLVRRLTPTECERLQGQEDGYTLVPDERGRPMADGPRYRMLGNSKAVNVVRWLGQRIDMVEAFRVNDRSAEIAA